MNRPKVNSEGQKELDRASESLDNFKAQAGDFNPFTGITKPSETEPQTKLSKREGEHVDAPEIKPLRAVRRPVGGQHKATVSWDEKYRDARNKDWELVKCIVENNELIGQEVEVWTAKWGCDPAHFWKVPVNKPIRIPRMLAEQLSKCNYHRLKMETNADAKNFVDANIVADHVVHRIDARPVGFGF